MPHPSTGLPRNYRSLPSLGRGKVPNALRRAELVIPVPEAFQKMGVREQTVCRWKGQNPGMGRASRSGDDFFYNAGRFHTGKPLVEAVMVVDQLLVIQSQQMENGGMEIMYTDSIF